MSERNGPLEVALAGGVAIPILGIGSFQMRGRRAYESLLYALRAGYRHIDTATGYGNESEVGKAVRDSGVSRSDIFITTKIPAENAGRERQTIEASLRALDMDYVDLWLIHWPPGARASARMWSELLAAREAGLTRAVGVSNYSPAQLDALIDAGGEAPALNQICWSPRLYDPARLRHSQERGIATEGYSPFKASDLRHPVLRAVAAAHEVTPAQVILRWHIDHGIIAIPKSVTPERIDANFDVFGFRLTQSEVERVDGISAT